jgi:sugar (pentulose or hexulose) kinase
MAGAIAVIDLGKTNLKLALLDGATRAELAVLTEANRTVEAAPYPHYDTEAIWRFILAGLAELGRSAPISRIAVATHGAAAALLAGDRLALPVLDYEHDGPEEARADYAAVRPPFAESFSPFLPKGLNLGSQLYWQQRRFPADFASATALLPWPQFWAWRLSGVPAAEVTSLGCHTDLWAPARQAVSAMTIALGWDRLLPPLRPASAVLGPLRPAVAAATGLGPACQVLCGIHDSNATLLPHLLRQPPPFAVLSTGTWAIALAVGGSLERLDPRRDCLANTDALGRPVPSARAMLGREFALLTNGQEAVPDERAIAAVLARQAMARPTLTPGVGPFPDGPGGWSHPPEALPAEERTAAASLYGALVADACLSLAGAAGPLIIEGPFARNALFCRALAALRPGPVHAVESATGTTAGAAALALPEAATSPALPPPVAAGDLPGLAAYAAAWRAAAG